jgi:putative tricarboxylic transport membrane protein
MGEPEGSTADAAAKARIDLLAALALLALGVAFLVASLGMDRLEARRIHPLSAPGLVPGLLGLALALCSALLGLQAIRAGALAGWRGATPLGRGAEPGAKRRLGLVLVLTLAYPLLLIGRLPYWLATWLFVSAFTILLEGLSADRAAPLWRTVLVAVALGGAVALAVSYLFQELFLVRLP